MEFRSAHSRHQEIPLWIPGGNQCFLFLTADILYLLFALDRLLDIFEVLIVEQPITIVTAGERFPFPSILIMLPQPDTKVVGDTGVEDCLTGIGCNVDVVIVFVHCVVMVHQVVKETFLRRSKADPKVCVVARLNKVPPG